MIAKPVTDISEADLRALIDNAVIESRVLEYKREVPDSSDQGKVKFLRSVTAFANTLGGDLIYGVEATKGIPVGFAPLPAASMDQTLQRLEQLCADGVAPRLPGLHFQPVAIDSGGFILVIRVPRSWTSPHRVVIKGHSHFYGRNANGAYPLDVAQLRQAFTLSADTAERIRAFRADRLLAIGSGEGPIDMHAGGVAVLHVIPLQALTSDQYLLNTSLQASNIPPLGSSGYNFRPNLDGWLTFRTDQEGKSFGYAQLFRNGIIETVDVLSLFEKKMVASVSYEQEVIVALSNYFRELQRLGVAPPAYVFYGMLGVAGYKLGIDRWRFAEPSGELRRQSLLLPEVLVNNWDEDPAQLMRPVFDMVWNAFGFLRSFNYDDSGKWQPA